MGILDVLQRKEEEEPRGILMVSQAPVEKSKPYTTKDFWKNWQKYLSSNTVWNVSGPAFTSWLPTFGGVPLSTN